MVLVVLSSGLSAWAHEALEDPIPRYPSDGFSDIKSCPCGLGGNDLTCSDPSARSDPNRAADRVNTYASGETITVRLREAVGHSGRWRIAFDPDGADQEDFDANVLLDVADPPGAQGNTGQGDLWELEVTLPDVGCDTCTLQVVQVMNGDTENPVDSPIGESTYWQCADLELVGGGPVDTDPPDPEPSTGDTAAVPDDAVAQGCGCDGAPGASPAWALGLLALRRRRTPRAG